MPCASVRSLEAFSLCLFDPRSLGSAGEAQFRLASLRADADFEGGPPRGFGGRPEQYGATSAPRHDSHHIEAANPIPTKAAVWLGSSRWSGSGLRMCRCDTAGPVWLASDVSRVVAQRAAAFAVSLGVGKVVARANLRRVGGVRGSSASATRCVGPRVHRLRVLAAAPDGERAPGRPLRAVRFPSCICIYDRGRVSRRDCHCHRRLIRRGLGSARSSLAAGGGVRFARPIGC